jgi:hypothetical protein
MKTCPFCAEEIQDAAIVCKHCGRSFSGRQVSQVGVLLAAFALIGFVYSVAFFDTSIAVGDGSRVNNLGLMQDRQIGITVSVVLGVMAALAFWKLPATESSTRRRIAGWAGVAVLVTAVVAVPISSNCASSVDHSVDHSLGDFNRLADGMSYAEAVKILGHAGVATSDSTAEAKTYTWETSDRRFYVTFRNDKLTSKSQGGIMKAK